MVRPFALALVLAATVALAVGGSASGVPTVALFTLDMSKTADASSATAGSVDGYTIEIDNPNDGAITMSVQDTLPVGFAYVAGSGSPAPSTVKGRTLGWSNYQALTPFSTIHFNVTVSSTPGTYYNSAGGSTADYPVNGTGPTAPITVIAPLTIAKTADAASAGPRASDGYTITVSNPNASAMTVSISDTLPSGFTYAGPTSGATTAPPVVSGQQLTWSNAFSVPASGSASMHFGVTTASTPGRYFDNATVTWPLGPASTASASTGATAPIDVVALPLTLSKTADSARVVVGSGDGYTISISNPNSTAVPLTLFDDLPGGFSYTPGSTTGATSGDPSVGPQRLTWSGISVPPGGASIHFGVKVATATGHYLNSASGSAGSYPVTGTGLTAPIDVLPAQLSMTKTSDAATVYTGGADGYTIAVSNSSSAPATISIADDLPPGFTYTTGSTSGATSGDPSIVGQRLTWSGISVPAGGSASLHFGVTASAAIGSYSNSASAAAPDGTPVGATGPTATVSVAAAPAPPPPPPPLQPSGTPAADLQVLQTVAPSRILPGDRVTYTFTVRNGGPSAAANALLTVDLGAGLTRLSTNVVGPTFMWTLLSTGCSGLHHVVCLLGTLGSGDAARVTIVARAREAGSLTGTASVHSDQTDPVGSNNAASAAARFVPPPVPGKEVNAEPVKGKVLVDGKPLTKPDQIHVGATVDTTHGEIRLITKNGDAHFYGGVFQIHQQASSRAVTELALRGGDFSKSCSQRTQLASVDRPLKTKMPVRQLWGHGKGHFRTRARYSSATVRGTYWLTADRCDGSLTKVREGVVTVEDFVRHTTVIVKARESYLAGPHVTHVKRQTARARRGHRRVRRG
jgi:uncharacterized repeat protein (TIGR01451 family)